MPLRVTTSPFPVEPKVYEPGDPPYYLVRIALEGEPEELAKVKVAKYTLPASFKDRQLFSDEPPFAVQVWTPGFFTVQVRLIKAEGKEEEFEGRVEFPVPSTMNSPRQSFA